MTRIDKKEIIKKIYWDKNIEPEYILGLLDGKIKEDKKARVDLYRRILNSYGWDTIVKLFSYEDLKDHVLDETVINRLYPKELRNKYRYARKILSDLIVSSSG
ncbi:MAG: hypothetical protein R6U68_11495 [Desulfobacteraceae bacterium]